MTQKDLADLLGISDQQVYRIEAGKQGTTLKRLREFAAILSVPESSLLEASVSALPPGAIPVGEMVSIPIIGVIRAGEPILATQNIEGYSLVTADEVQGGDHFYLRVKGDSMIGARILEGDLVLVRQQPDVEDGEIAVVLVDDEEATLKRVYRDNGRWLLKPENPTMRPIVVDKRDVQIIGRVIEVKFRV
jgi:repressor LexA